MTRTGRGAARRYGAEAEGRGDGQVAALLLAAGGGRRLGGRPKALLRRRGRPLVEHAVQVLRAGGCTEVHVVLGAEAARVRDEAELPGCVLVDNPHWEEGMGSSLRTGLASLASPGSPPRPSNPSRSSLASLASPVPAPDHGATPAAPAAALVLLVDQPGVTAAAVARVRSAYHSPRTLAAAAYGGRRGHPVLFGADHWPGILAAARGDRGARDYLAVHADVLVLVECGDVAEPYDIDTPDDLSRLT